MSGNQSSSNGKTCVVLGGRGFVGGPIVQEAARRGYDVKAVGREDYEAAAGLSCDLLINANGNAKKFLASKDPKADFDLSVRSVMNSVRDFDAAHYVYISSVDVYSNRRDPACNSEATPIIAADLGPYGFHKYLAEQIVQHGAPSWSIMRMGGFVGPNLKKNAIYDLLHDQPLRLHPDSAYQYLNTEDAAVMVLDLVEAGFESETINMCGAGVLTLREVASWLDRALPAALDDLPKDRCEVNLEKLNKHMDVPDTKKAVKAFVDQVRSGGSVAL